MTSANADELMQQHFEVDCVMVQHDDMLQAPDSEPLEITMLDHSDGRVVPDPAGSCEYEQCRHNGCQRMFESEGWSSRTMLCRQCASVTPDYNGWVGPHSCAACLGIDRSIGIDSATTSSSLWR